MRQIFPWPSLNTTWPDQAKHNLTQPFATFQNSYPSNPTSSTSTFISRPLLTSPKISQHLQKFHNLFQTSRTFSLSDSANLSQLFSTLLNLYQPYTTWLPHSANPSQQHPAFKIIPVSALLGAYLKLDMRIMPDDFSGMIIDYLWFLQDFNLWERSSVESSHFNNEIFI